MTEQLAPTTEPDQGDAPPRVVVVGGGFAGYHTLRHLERMLPASHGSLTLVAPQDYLLYSPLLPEVATGVLDPRDIAVSLRQTLRRTKPLFGHVVAVDLDGRTLTVAQRDGRSVTQEWDRLVLAPGSVTRQLDIPGVAEHARGMKTLAEAVFLRDHLLAQLDHADSLPETEEARALRRELLTVVAVGAGYTGTETVAQLQHWISGIAGRWSHVGPDDLRWLLVDLAPHVLPELGPRLGDEAMKVLGQRGIEVRLQVSVASATETSVTLTDGDVISTRTLIWGAGVAASPLVAALGLPTTKGRLDVHDDLSLPGHPGVWALGDAAAVPDLTQPAGPDGRRPVAGSTAQHAQRQGRVAARNVAASLGVGRPRSYRHHDLGLVADLGGSRGVARPLGVPLTGALAKVVARGYHLYALPSASAKVRVATDWLYASVLPTRVVRLDDVQPYAAQMATAQHTGIYPAAQ